MPGFRFFMRKVSEKRRKENTFASAILAPLDARKIGFYTRPLVDITPSCTFVFTRIYELNIPHKNSGFADAVVFNSTNEFQFCKRITNTKCVLPACWKSKQRERENSKTVLNVLEVMFG